MEETGAGTQPRAPPLRADVAGAKRAAHGRVTNAANASGADYPAAGLFTIFVTRNRRTASTRALRRPWPCRAGTYWPPPFA